jgi:hypothetical protein
VLLSFNGVDDTFGILT